MRLSHVPLQPSAIIRLVIGLATWNYCRIAAQVEGKLPTPKPGETPVLMQSSLEELQIPVATGQLFAPDELISGVGNELKYLIEALQSLPPNQTLRTEYDASRKDIDAISLEVNRAVMYSCAVEYWLDCVGFGYGLTHHRDGVAHVPFDVDQEFARTVSSYRRLHLWLQDKFDIYEEWTYQLPDAAKRQLCEIPLVSQVCLAFDRIERIELSQNSRVLESAIVAVADKVLLQRWYYKNLLDEPLPKLHNFTLTEMINGWRLLQSLASVVFDEVSSRIVHNAKELPRFAPKIAARVLCATVSKALRMEKHRAQQLVEVFVFRDRSSQEVWTQPLVRCADDYWLVIPCIHSVQLEPIVEGWMRQGGLELERRGPEFERFCRELLRIFVALSPIKEAVTLVKQPVQFSPPGEQGEEIDLVIVIADTVRVMIKSCG